MSDSYRTSAEAKPFEEDAVAIVKALSKHYEPWCDHCAQLVEIAREKIAAIVERERARR